MYQLLNIYSKTVRVRFINPEILTDHLEKNGRIIIGSWHQRFFGGFYLPKKFKRPICIMISRSRDGDFIANVVRRIGWLPIRGSSSRGGKEASVEMVRGIIENRIGGHIADGPTGPPRVIKAGLIALAQKTGAAITNAYVYYENPFVFKSWDRFMVPKPFSRVVLRFGPLLFVPEKTETEEFENLRRGIEEELIAGYEKEALCWEEH
ncbi:MAG: lysophospholipid acyltransferase family protein [Thermodesulfobacteriota bacterium]|nr:lysophospholipid acyltransferase family protein [Thermodesulfobacteriota bacterium]